ncbi:hypothetical protein TNCV_494921 [Trichonephila clavipes]|nr:hypothetical protein TNCV_494921 [Trichonephila clavipes]
MKRKPFELASQSSINKGQIKLPQNKYLACVSRRGKRGKNISNKTASSDSCVFGRRKAMPASNSKSRSQKGKENADKKAWLSNLYRLEKKLLRERKIHQGTVDFYRGSNRDRMGSRHIMALSYYRARRPSCKKMPFDDSVSSEMAAEHLFHTKGDVRWNTILHKHCDCTRWPCLTPNAIAANIL